MFYLNQRSTKRHAAKNHNCLPAFQHCMGPGPLRLCRADRPLPVDRAVPLVPDCANMRSIRERWRILAIRHHLKTGGLRNAAFVLSDRDNLKLKPGLKNMIDRSRFPDLYRYATVSYADERWAPKDHKRGFEAKDDTADSRPQILKSKK